MDDMAFKARTGDLVERLRTARIGLLALCADAADEIEALRGQSTERAVQLEAAIRAHKRHVWGEIEPTRGCDRDLYAVLTKNPSREQAER